MTRNRWYNLTLTMIAFAAVTLAGQLQSAFAQTEQPASEQLTDEQTKFFETKIRPVLAAKCYSCHSRQAGQTKGGLQLDTRDGLLAGGDNGASIIVGDPDASILIQALEYEDFAMPPSKQLAANTIADFRHWVEMGAPDPRVAAKLERDYTAQITPEKIAESKTKWPYTAPVASDPPVTKTADWARGPIDQFVLSKLEQASLKPAADADALALVRRLSYDLIGLPPDQEQVDWFVVAYAEDPDRAVAIAVDGLLESPRFGERWGRHWLDVARYAESTGREHNATYPYAYRYRDYVIDSFNNDKPYDRFIREQIAGDLLPVNDDEQWAENLTATGFLTIGPKALRETNPRQFALDLVDEQLDVTTRVFLGMSVACARCHDHKFDPIPQDDYYRMAGIFLSTSTHYGTPDSRQNRRPSNLIVMPVPDKDSKFKSIPKRELEEMKREIVESKKKYDESRRARRRSQNRPDTAAPKLSQGEERRLGAEISVLEQMVNSVDENGRPLSFVMAVQDRLKPVNARVLIRGEVDQPSDEVDRGLVQVLSGGQPQIKRGSSGRLEMADWLADKSNPLTARVMANRIWKHLLGNGIVRSTENFGTTGTPPTHTELLDHLAIEFMENGWSIKELIRKIATSRIYRRSSQFNQVAFESDPDNELLWRHTPRRLDAEALRDTMLFASRQIDLERPDGSIVSAAGPTVVRDGEITSSIELVREIREATGGSMNEAMDNAGSGGNRANSMRRMRDLREKMVSLIDDAEVNYRSVYLPVVRDNVPTALAAFDFAEPSMVVGVRGTTNSPVQCLYLLNDDFVIRQSAEMAASILKRHKTVNGQLNAVFRRTYGRNASAGELAALRGFIETFKPESQRTSDKQARLAAICQAIFASAEFRFLD